MADFHPLAGAFPLITGDDFDELVADIREHGLLTPVWMYEGKILDGRNRYRACQQLGIPHTERKYMGSDPAAFVWSVNAVRRQLTPAQRAMAATKLVTARASMNQHTVKDSVTTKEAAKMAAVGQRTTERARKVIVAAVPEVVQAVEAGEMSLSTAERVSDLPEAEQAKIMETVPVADVPKAVPDTRVRHLAVVREESGGEPQVKATGRGVPGPKVQLVRQLETSSAEGAKMRTLLWAENKELIPGLDGALLETFVKNLRAERLAIEQLLKLIKLSKGTGEQT
jgi:hypothetical protein